MAKKVQVLLVDDIDKSSPADETVSFSLDGVSYEIDLTSDNAAKLRDDLAVWIGHAERTGGRRVDRLARRPRAPVARPTSARCAPGPARTATRSATAAASPPRSRPPTTRPTAERPSPSPMRRPPTWRAPLR